MDYEETEGKSSIFRENQHFFQKCSKLPRILKKHRFFGTILSTMASRMCTWKWYFEAQNVG